MTQEEDQKLDEEMRKAFSATLEGNLITVTFLIGNAQEVGNIRIAKLIAAQLDDFAAKDRSKFFNVLIDLSNLHEKVSFLSKDVRDLYSELMNHPQGLRVALFGANSFYDIAVNMMIKAAKKEEKVRIFRTREEALAWLGQTKQPA
jgi:hypothetical protein